MPQSMLNTAGRDATEIAAVFWWMTGGAVLIWVGVTVLILYASAQSRRTQVAEGSAHRLIVIAGVVTPAVVLTVLLIWGLQPLARGQAVLAEAGEDLLIEVEGEQWWWRVRYISPDGAHIETANELRLPRDARIRVRLSSDNVIHSFWIPSLAGKVDMIPGRTTQLMLEPTRTGTFRGVCAEYCGTSHAAMAFVVQVLPADEFDAWLKAQAAPARTTEAQTFGQQAFAAHGCAACHSVRGTPALGRIGPDLTHLGSRLSLAAGALSNDASSLARWIRDPQRIKPDALMPAYGMLGEEQLQALVSYVGGLR